MKKLLFSLTAKDFRVDTFTVKGPGGSGKDTSNTGVRITHPESGAVGQSSDERSQPQNKKKAFERLVNSSKFKLWHRLKTASALAGYEDIGKMIEKRVEQEMRPENLKIEVRTDEGWKEYKGE